MGALSIWHMLIVILIVALFVPPVIKILHRMGYSGWWVLIGVISPLNIIGLWYLAYSRWPAEDFRCVIDGSRGIPRSNT
jgi:hypothetical protein